MARSILEDCDISSETKIRNLLTIGTPNMGVSEMPLLKCNVKDIKAHPVLCRVEHLAMVIAPYTNYMQKNFASAGYVRNTADLGDYLKGATFLPALNNEIGNGTAAYKRHKERIKALNAAMFVEFTKDHIVFPRVSEVFGQVTGESASLFSDKRVTEPVTNTTWYKDDALGLQSLNKEGKVQLVKIDGEHIKFTENDVK